MTARPPATLVWHERHLAVPIDSPLGPLIDSPLGLSVAYHRAECDSGFYTITPLVERRDRGGFALSPEGGCVSFSRVIDGTVTPQMDGVHTYPSRAMAMVAATCHLQFGQWP